MPDDAYFMRRALILARQGRGAVSPNPMVGCVVVKSDKIIAQGWHKQYGHDHAEVDALKKAGVRAKGSSMYVTLEPCFHWGRTPPCVDAILAAGVKRVVIAMVDPNSKTRGKSIAKLRAAGIDVAVGLCEDDARLLNEVFIKYMVKKMPFTVVKSAQTLDGKIAARSGDSKWITSGVSRRFAREKRNEFDAILVGIGTVLADDPQLNAPAKRIKKIIVDSRLRIPATSRLFKGAIPGQVILAATGSASRSRIRHFEKRGVCVMLCPENKGRVDLKSLFKALAKSGITSILIEGGASVIGSALKAGLVDQMHVYIAPRLIGDEKARSSVVGMDVLKVSQAKTLKLTTVERLGPDILLTLKV